MRRCVCVCEQQERLGATIVSICRTYHCWYLARHERLARREAHLLHQRVLQCQMIAPVYQELVLEMLRRMEVLARRFLPVTPTLKQQRCDNGN